HGGRRAQLAHVQGGEIAGRRDVMVNVDPVGHGRADGQRRPEARACPRRGPLVDTNPLSRSAARSPAVRLRGSPQPPPPPDSTTKTAPGGPWLPSSLGGGPGVWPLASIRSRGGCPSLPRAMPQAPCRTPSPAVFARAASRVSTTNSSSPPGPPR